MAGRVRSLGGPRVLAGMSAAPDKTLTPRLSAASFCHAIRAALDREARQAKLNGTPVDALEGISEAWVGGVRAR